MKTTLKYIIAGIPIIAVSLLIDRCKSPEPHTETSAVVTTNTIDTVDSTEAPVIVSTDTVHARMPLTLIIKNLTSPNSPVYATFYEVRNKFLSQTDILKGYKLIPNGNTLTAQLTGLAYGELAIATYQDVNCDGKCNRSIIGIPKEPYGFSNNYRPTIKAPRFGDCKFTYSAKSDTLIIAMIK